MNKVKILWSRITGRTGQEALKVIKDNNIAEIDLDRLIKEVKI